MTAEERRLEESRERKVHWKRWGPYLSERAWGTVREDYSPYGEAWDYFPHDYARSRPYRWNEDGLAGVCDRRQIVCLALALWNERDPILKERVFGLTGSEGNHGEDVKEYYFYLDSTPTHSYMKYLYKYPQAEFPYGELVEENRRRGRGAPEYELLDTGVFDEDRYFDVFVEYAKADAEDLLGRITIVNRGPAPARLRVLPTVWFRNTWSWGRADGAKPQMRAGGDSIEIDTAEYGRQYLHCEGAPELLFTENAVNAHRLYGAPNGEAFVKDGVNDFVVSGVRDAVNPAQVGTKAAAHYTLELAPGASAVIRFRLNNGPSSPEMFGPEFDRVFAMRQAEADEFYGTVIPADLSSDARLVMRQAFAGLLWSKQFYHYVIKDWLEGDPAQPAPPAARRGGRNREWGQLYNADVISMPDKWEYPWYAAWDLAFHCIPLALVDSEFAKEQLALLLREWYMHPNGQLPAYEWAFGDVNPPVHAWAAWRVYKIEKARRGVGDRRFLERVFQKLLLNFTWWVNRKDAEGMNIFQGGFLGLDNIGVFDRSAPLPTGGHMEQSDGTSWMAMYTLNMLAIAMELARENPAYEDVASKFWEHFLYIAHAMNNRGADGIRLWNDEDGFFYDVLHLPDGSRRPLNCPDPRPSAIVEGLRPLQWILTLLALASGCSLEVDVAGGRYHCDDGVCPAGFECSSERVCVQAGDDGGAGGSDAPLVVADGTPGTSDAAPGADASPCGNGTLELGEECDDGNATDTDGCRNDCSWASCGDGTTRQGVEACDDGNTSSLDACSSSCQLCTGVTIDATGHCYEWGGIVEDWFAGSFTCASKDGYLASVTSSTERLFLAGQAPVFPYWVGLNDLQTEATYVWFNGEPQAQTEIPWDFGQPNGTNDNNDCIRAQAPDGELNDLGCTPATTASPLCEIEGWKVRASDRHAYRFVHVQDDAAGHDAACAARGAHLATIDAAGESAFVAGLGAGSYWIGPFTAGNCKLATLGPGSFTSSTASCSQLAFALCEID